MAARKDWMHDEVVTVMITVRVLLQDDLVCLPPKAAAALGGFGPLALCTRVSNTLTLTDTQTLRSVQVDVRLCTSCLLQHLCSTSAPLQHSHVAGLLGDRVILYRSHTQPSLLLTSLQPLRPACPEGLQGSQLLLQLEGQSIILHYLMVRSSILPQLDLTDAESWCAGRHVLALPLQTSDVEPAARGVCGAGCRACERSPERLSKQPLSAGRCAGVLQDAQAICCIWRATRVVKLKWKVIMAVHDKSYHGFARQKLASSKGFVQCLRN